MTPAGLENGSICFGSPVTRRWPRWRPAVTRSRVVWGKTSRSKLPSPSGEIFLAFSPPARVPRGEAPAAPPPDRTLDDLFEAVVDATEESVVNALWAAPEVTGRDGRVARALPHDDVLALLERSGRLAR